MPDGLLPLDHAPPPPQPVTELGRALARDLVALVAYLERGDSAGERKRIVALQRSGLIVTVPRDVQARLMSEWLANHREGGE